LHACNYPGFPARARRWGGLLEYTGAVRLWRQNFVALSLNDLLLPLNNPRCNLAEWKGSEFMKKTLALICLCFMLPSAARAGSTPVSYTHLLRAFEVNWLRTQLPNSTNNAQNDVHFGAGIVFRFP